MRNAAVAKVAQPIGTYPAAQMLTFLKRTDKRKQTLKKGYRTIDTDKLTLFNNIGLAANKGSITYSIINTFIRGCRPRIIVRVYIGIELTKHLKVGCFYLCIAIIRLLLCNGWCNSCGQYWDSTAPRARSDKGAASILSKCFLCQRVGLIQQLPWDVLLSLITI
jgi:hypothetical protein